MRPQYREPFFQKLFIHDCPRCGEHLYCDVTVGPGLSVGTAADGTAELTIHAKATPQQHLCAGVSSAPTAEVVHCGRTTRHEPHDYRDTVTVTRSCSGAVDSASEAEKGGELGPVDRPKDNGASTPVETLVSGPQEASSASTPLPSSDTEMDWRGIHNDEGAELLREVVMERKWSTESWMRAKAWAAEGENQESVPGVKCTCIEKDRIANGCPIHNPPLGMTYKAAHDAPPDMWHCNKCGYTGTSGPDHDVFPDGGACNYAAANMSEWERRKTTDDVGKDAKDRAHRAAGGVLNRAGHDYFPESDLWRAVEAALKRFEEVHSNPTESTESV